MSSTCESDPYERTHTDTDEDYVPDNANPNLQGARSINTLVDSSDESAVEIENVQQPTTSDVTPQRGKKRIVRQSIWKRNIRKIKRTKGESYINTAGRQVREKQIGGNCNCQLKCYDEIGVEGCQKIFTDFYTIPSKDLQVAYLYGLMQRNSVAWKRPRSGDGINKNASFIYKVRHGREERRICKKAFLGLHGITKARLERLQKHVAEENVSAPIDQRGRHQSRPNKIPDSTDAKIREHILSNPKYKSHYSRKDNIQHFYLSPFLNVSKMHEMYLAKNESEQYQLLKENHKIINPVVKYEYFRKYFAENFKMTQNLIPAKSVTNS